MMANYYVNPVQTKHLPEEMKSNLFKATIVYDEKEKVLLFYKNGEVQDYDIIMAAGLNPDSVESVEISRPTDFELKNHMKMRRLSKRLGFDVFSEKRNDSTPILGE